ncbi:hypothetical protein PCANC_27200 [Puccinia coronata f. sp. avenae]|uniref:Uncharacterized protein n=1 Tax=Puccinia coronata f. sp. avenae TaxID=200324 RepID=A0A2N5RVH2_9BASI|nr:hypothetical protein PCANC_27200 [Puccinia coronata f. sp. avenae]
MAGSEDDDSYQQKIDPALRHCQYHTSRALPYAEADTPSTSTSTSDRRINLNNHNKGTSQPIAHDLLHPVHPARPTLQPKLRRSTSYTVSSHSSSSASSPESHSPKFLPATFSTGSIAEISPPHRLTKPTHSSSFQDFQSSIKSTRSHPFTNGHHQNLRIPPPFSPGEQTALTTTSQESIGRNPTTINRQEFGEQWLINQRNPPSEEDAKPNDKISAELDYSLQRLINLDVFRQVLEDPTSRHTFREAIIEGLSFDSAPPNLSLTKLDLWNDCRGMNQILNLLKIGTSGLSDIYLHHAHSQTSLDQVLPELNGGGGTGIQDRLLRSLTRFNLLLDAEENEDRISHYDEVEEKDVEFGGLKAIENKLLISLYQNEFPLFLKKTLVSNVVVKLGKFNLNEQDRNGLETIQLFSFLKVSPKSLGMNAARLLVKTVDFSKDLGLLLKASRE